MLEVSLSDKFCTTCIKPVFLVLLVCALHLGCSTSFKTAAVEPSFVISFDKSGKKTPYGEVKSADGRLSFVGRKMSIVATDADVVDVILEIAKVVGVNVSIGQGVSGKVSINMSDVPWDQALYEILRKKGLGSVAEQNVIRIESSKTLIRKHYDSPDKDHNTLRGTIFRY